MAKEELFWGDSWVKLDLNANEVSSAVGWSLGWEERAGLKLKTKYRGLAPLHPYFRVGSQGAPEFEV